MTQRQLIPESYNNRSLFSDYYLASMVDQDPHWQAVMKRASALQAQIKRIFDTAMPGLTEDTPEAELERRLIRPVLDSLGHHYYVQKNVRISEGQKIPDYSFFATEADMQDAEQNTKANLFYENAITVGEAKKWNRPLDRRIHGTGDPFTNQNPSYQIDYYLRATKKKWGILTNGRVWRLYQRDLSYRLDVYYEVDLYDLLYSDGREFLYFAAFFCREAFVQDNRNQLFLDRAYEQSTAYASELGDELRENVYSALRLLTEGLLVHPSNYLNESNLDLIRENAFTVIFRLLFVFFSESPRKGHYLLPIENSTYQEKYSLHSLARSVSDDIDTGRSLSPTATNYWSHLIELFRLIDVGDPHIEIPAYNGGLFEDAKHPFLAEHRIGDSYLAAAIDLLARTRSSQGTELAFVAYGDLGVRELGSIYEGLLEQQPRVAHETMVVVRDGDQERITTEVKANGKFAIDKYVEGQVYLTLHQGERKSTGSYYTPEHIVKFIVRSCLDPLIDDLREKELGLLDGILSLKILDPAMGSGHFLVETVDYLAGALVDVLGGDQETDEDDVRWARREIVERCIYGVDLNPLAVELAKLSLWLITASRNKPLNFLDHHLRCGNALVGEWVQEQSVPPSVGKSRREVDSSQIPMFVDEDFTKTIGLSVGDLDLISGMPSDEVNQVKEKARILDELIDARRGPYRQIANLKTSFYFGNIFDSPSYRALLAYLSGNGLQNLSPKQAQIYLDNAESKAGEYRFFHWELEFPEVFFDRNGLRLANPGFDSIIGNPPYDVLEKDRLSKENPHEELAKYLKNTPFYQPALGGKINVFRPFLIRELRLLRDNGTLGKIVPLSIANDYSCSRTRKTLLENSNLSQLMCFPQKDDPSERVFKDAKLSTCIPIFRKSGATTDFVVQIHPGKRIIDNPKQVNVSISEMAIVDPEVLPIPIVSQSEWNLAVRLHAYPRSNRISDIGTLTRGEINQTVFKRFISTNPSHFEMMKGVQIDRYSENLFLSQGEKQWFDEAGYQQVTKNPKTLPEWRIAIQRITGIDDSTRLIAVLLDRRAYLADSTNSVAHEDIKTLNFLLALINSKFFNWRFKLTSTNNNVATNELDRIPVRAVKFSTPLELRQTLANDAKGIYENCLETQDIENLLKFVSDRLPLKSDGAPDENHEQSDVVHDILAFLSEEMAVLNKVKQSEVKQFLNWLENYLGTPIDTLSNKRRIREYWRFNVKWQEFRTAVIQNNHRIVNVELPGYQTEQPIQDGFYASQERLEPILNRIWKTDQFIDQIVYRLYGLSELDIRIIEGREVGV